MKKEEKKAKRPSRGTLLSLVSSLSYALRESNRIISECFDSSPNMAPEDWNDHRSLCDHLLEEATEATGEDS